MNSQTNFYGRRVAVTGATGMVGSHLVAAMVRAGYTDIVLPVRNPARVAVLRQTFARLGMELPGTIRIITTELTDTEALTNALAGVDTVFNCAARILSGGMTTQQLIDNNVSIARSVADACVGSGVRKIMHVSSIAALGGAEGELIDERFSPANLSQESAYGQSKYLSEQQIWRVEAGPANPGGIEVVCVLPGVILGEGQWTGQGSGAMIPFISKGIPAYTTGVMSYVDIRDVTDAILLLDTCPGAAGERFVLSAGNVGYRELLTLGARAAGRPRPFIRVGPAPIHAAYYLMKALTAVHLMKDRGITKRNLTSITRGNRYDGSKIEKFCNFAYRPLQDTVERVVKAYLAESKTLRKESGK